MPESTEVDIRPIPDCVRASCLRFPESIAITHGAREQSYAELDLHSSRLAGYLSQLGVVPGKTVAICLERSTDWIVAALGAMRAGAAYVPLDPAWPDSRLRFAVNDSGASVLISSKSLSDRLRLNVINIDLCRDTAVIAANSAPVDVEIQPDSLAYVIYTSGSTGTPKGVEITHANLTSLVQWHLEAFSVTSADRASHLAGLGFDAAVWEIWPYLSAGATLCIPDDAVRSSPELIQQWMVQERVSIGFVPTVHAMPLIGMEWPEATSLRYLLTGGDALRHGPSVALPFTFVNNYGPTECTVVATSGTVHPGLDGVPPIGSAIAGATIYLLDETRQEVPAGATGEIYVGGNGVGRGYRNLPEATEQSFLPDPFTERPGGRMYRTGDRGVRRSDGQIEFRGRLDRQTKIRGQRVELDEVGAALESHPAVVFAAVISTVSETGDNQLVAYVVFEDDTAINNAHDLQKHLQVSLPDYMIPRLFVKLDKTPISANGKVDLTILPVPSDSNLLRTMPSRTAGTPTEEKLLDIVKDLLDNDFVTFEDNFLLAGGHSLLGMQLITRLRNAFDVDLGLRQIFEAPSVETLAELVDTTLRQNRLAAIWADLLDQNHVGPDDNVFEMGGSPEMCSELQERIYREFGRDISVNELFENPTVRQQIKLISAPKPQAIELPPGITALQPNGTRPGIFWIQDLSLDLAKELGERQPFFSVGFTKDDLRSLGAAPSLETIAAYLVAKIRLTQPEGPYTIGGICLGGILASEVANQLRSSGQEVPLLIVVDSPNPQHLGRGNPLTPRLSEPSYIFRRLAHLGPTTSLRYFRDYVSKQVNRLTTMSAGRDVLKSAQSMIEVAAADYTLKDYKGNTLLFICTKRPPRLDFLPGWKAALSGALSVIHVDTHHRDILHPPIVTMVANEIQSHLSNGGIGNAAHLPFLETPSATARHFDSLRNSA